MHCKIAHLLKLTPLSDMAISQRVVANFQCFLNIFYWWVKRHTFYTKSKDQLLDKKFQKTSTQLPHMTVW